MSMGPNPYASGAGGGVPPEDLVKKAGNMQLMGILSIVLGMCCCPPIGLVLGILVMVQAPGVLQSLQQYGGAADVVGKVNTGKTCAIIGLVLSALSLVGNTIYGIVTVMNQ